MSRRQGNRNQHAEKPDDMTPREHERLAAEYALWREQRYAHLLPIRSSFARRQNGQSRQRGEAAEWHLAALEYVVADRRARRETRNAQQRTWRAKQVDAATEAH